MQQPTPMDTSLVEPRPPAPPAQTVVTYASMPPAPAPATSKAEQLAIPKAAVKRIMKLDPEVNQIATDAVVLVAKATEMFLEKFSAEA
eukprot:CAMPEP_0119286170 /NCGR_PEP_ID=MMETSP1329-20130426/33446_1 /TAXON_ID=114041 /ORGANISM="Genus nov. species nov., Strain RCC1024" /LENGTH=87 /DNA_ID=CAMNT_0007286899 /DNA_START=146 /DNA_END=405 /DNA_ORIENTATION=+